MWSHWQFAETPHCKHYKVVIGADFLRNPFSGAQVAVANDMTACPVNLLTNPQVFMSMSSTCGLKRSEFENCVNATGSNRGTASHCDAQRRRPFLVFRFVENVA